MSKKELDKLMSYYINELTRLERELNVLQSNLRYRYIDHIDCLELILTLERLEIFKRIFKDIYYLLNLKKYVDGDD